MTASQMTLVCVCGCVWVCVGGGAVVGGVQQVEQVDSSGGSWRHNEFTAASRAIALKPPVPPFIAADGARGSCDFQLAASAFARERSAGGASINIPINIDPEFHSRIVDDFRRPSSHDLFCLLCPPRPAAKLDVLHCTARGGRSSE